MSKDSMPQNQAKAPKPPTEPRDEPGTYVHEPAGIRERSGSIPTWLTLVAVGLILWGMYYMIRYWSSY
jgi:hypothetical protein